MRNHVARICREVNATCRRLGSHKTGHEERTLTPLHAFCTKNPDVSVAYCVEIKIQTPHAIHAMLI